MDTADTIALLGSISTLLVSLGITYLIVRIGMAVGKFSSGD